MYVVDHQVVTTRTIVGYIPGRSRRCGLVWFIVQWGCGLVDYEIKALGISWLGIAAPDNFFKSLKKDSLDEGIKLEDGSLLKICQGPVCLFRHE